MYKLNIFLTFTEFAESQETSTCFMNSQVGYNVKKWKKKK